ncbi:MAG: OprO/OprP family phosphate-selective porin [Gemmatimonadales bacterium]
MIAVRKALAGLLLASGAVVRPHRVFAQESASCDTLVQSLAVQVHDLDQQLRILRRLRELAAAGAMTGANDRVRISAGNGFSIESADGNYSLRLRGYLQSDGRLFPGPETGTDNLLIRRARPILEATAGRYFDFRLMPDFGGTSPAIFDAYWEGRFAPQLRVRAGKFKPPIGLERLQSATDIAFAERGLPTNLVPSREVGLQVAGDIGEGLLAYQVGVFNGVPDLANGGDDPSDAKDFAARIFVQPFKTGALRELGIGVAGSTGLERGSTGAPALPSYRTPGQQVFFRYTNSSSNPAGNAFADGKRLRLSPQGYFYTGSFGLLGEYVVSRNEVTAAGLTSELGHTAWGATGSFFLTGEKAGFRSPAPRRPFDLEDGGFGAVELVGRYGELELDEASFPAYAAIGTSAAKASSWGLGVNWHFTRAVRIAVNYERTSFRGGAPTGDREPEDAVITRFQTSF